ncbi:Cyclic di-GMP phosphodiesterase response regulator RpfG [Pseudodesulfovibrio hydrargyri]|uniref:Cyclic di-GMP phosphodiesterase response regulator RpfG n=1 Tax=Pseudodesulfovibrio hydrargyri TaxID=2125990 RepID=A0A1J5MUL3_9BACT|nr:HD domain-containing phosphohydrolase [Pseudodesulfovibrio hydrargyri]OIQ50294.1 Cyclic di-GMP phosphodiesterase response regulator RpfG [Pseudodesulfovibrio hydrargyri]
MSPETCSAEILASLIEIARAAEARTESTAFHSEKVARVAHGIAKALDRPKNILERLLIVGRLHNIGLVGTSDAVLRKTGKLSPQEFKHIQEHTRLGAALLAPIPALADVAEVCLSHHERWDGSGYPNGLAGSEIPRLARLISVADTYCAMISERPHRDSLPRAVAAEVIAEERDKQLCPECVDGFLTWYKKTDGRIDLF